MSIVLKSLQEWRWGNKAVFPHVGEVLISKEGLFEAPNEEVASALIKQEQLKIVANGQSTTTTSTTTSTTTTTTTKIEDQVVPGAPLESEGAEGENISSKSDSDSSSAKEELASALASMKLEDLKTLAEERGYPKNQWNRLGEAKLREYLLNQI